MMMVFSLAPRSRRSSALPGLLTALLCLPLDTVPAGAGASEAILYGLPALVERALQHNANVQQQRWKTAAAAADLDQALAARILPRLRLESIGGLVPDAKGDIFNPPDDTTGVRELGPFSQTELEFVQPLYTFGQLSSLRNAAEAGVDASRAALADAELEAALEVKELYNGILLARELADLVRELREELAEREEEVDLDDADLPLATSYKLQLVSLELDTRQRQLDATLDLARATMAWRCGMAEDEDWEPEARFLARDSTHVPTLDTLTALAARRRPEWRRLQAGIAARQALESAARAAYYPQFFLAGGFRYGVAPGRTDQHNPFAVDDYNFSSLGMFVGMRQSFEWGLLGAKRDKARAELLELESQEQSAADGIRLDVNRAYSELEVAAAGLTSAEDGRSLGQRWVHLAAEAYEFTEEADDLKALVTAFEGFAKTEQAYFQAVYDYNVSLARLERAVGVTFAHGHSHP